MNSSMQMKSTLGGNMCSPVAEERETEVVRAMCDLRCVVERYNRLVAMLHSRLACVTTPITPVGSDATKEAGGYCTDLANSIDAVRREIRDITNNLEGLYERIEL